MNTARKPVKEVDLRVVLRESTHNQRARAILRRYYRGVLDMTQEEFAAELSKEFHGDPPLTTEERLTQLEDAALYEPTGRKPRRRGPRGRL
jgi:uncharacterized protein (UPF0371 family)